MKPLTKSMFDEIKSSLVNKNESSFKDILKFEKGKNYIVRLLPNMSDPRQTIYHYYHHSWSSLATGQFVTALCPTTYGDTCPIDAYVMKTYRLGSEEEKEKIKAISRKENWLVNVYVVSDPSNPENEGKVKVLRYGRELAKVITAAMEGDDADEFGVKIFDVLNGCPLKIKCESRAATGKGNNTFVSYSSSRFMPASKLDGVNETQLEELLSNTPDLTKFNKPRSTAELQRMLDQHFFCVQDAVEPVDEAEDGTVEEKVVKQQKPAPKAKPKATKESEPVEDNLDTDEDTDAKLKDLLADL